MLGSAIMGGQGMHPEREANPHAKRPKVSARAIEIVIEKAWDQGWWCKKGKKSHVKLYSPDGRYIVTLPSSPSDHRGIRNARQLLKKYGLDLKG
jgi:predicted RNA binding protein YcfA (HicA-like mRNA interferase family)